MKIPNRTFCGGLEGFLFISKKNFFSCQSLFKKKIPTARFSLFLLSPILGLEPEFKVILWVSFRREEIFPLFKGVISFGREGFFQKSSSSWCYLRPKQQLLVFQKIMNHTRKMRRGFFFFNICKAIDDFWRDKPVFVYKKIAHSVIFN